MFACFLSFRVSLFLFILSSCLFFRPCFSSRGSYLTCDGPDGPDALVHARGAAVRAGQHFRLGHAAAPFVPDWSRLRSTTGVTVGASTAAPTAFPATVSATGEFSVTSHVPSAANTPNVLNAPNAPNAAAAAAAAASGRALASLPPEIQDTLLADELLFAFMGIEGRYLRRVTAFDARAAAPVLFQLVAPGLDPVPFCVFLFCLLATFFVYPVVVSVCCSFSLLYFSRSFFLSLFLF